MQPRCLWRATAAARVVTPRRPLRLRASMQPLPKFPTQKCLPSIPEGKKVCAGATASHSPFLKPIALVACGSFSPITFLHLRLFGTALIEGISPTETETEQARDWLSQNEPDVVIIGGYLSPVSDAYGKKVTPEQLPLLYCTTLISARTSHPLLTVSPCASSVLETPTGL